LTLLVAACQTYHVVPEPLAPSIDWDLGFTDLARAPQSYQGRLVVLGGTVMAAARREDRTEIEILQLPLSSQLIPKTEDLAQSQGRFYAVDTSGRLLDPSVVPAGEPVTVIGEVLPPEDPSAVSGPHIPRLRLRDLTTWEKMPARRWPYYAYPSYGGFHWYGARPMGVYW
jgi:starvation-inducible outer membrane lipoprotein